MNRMRNNIQNCSANNQPNVLHFSQWTLRPKEELILTEGGRGQKIIACPSVKIKHLMFVYATLVTSFANKHVHADCNVS